LAERPKGKRLLERNKRRPVLKDIIALEEIESEMWRGLSWLRMGPNFEVL
jgi:hypothetical protein